MSKKSSKKLTLAKQTLTRLDNESLRSAQGAAGTVPQSWFCGYKQTHSWDVVICCLLVG